MPRKLTKEIINSRLTEDGRGIIMTGDYHGLHFKSEFKCSYGHQWCARVGSVVSDRNGCSYCDRLSKEIVNGRLKEECRNITMIGDYVNVGIKTTFLGECGHQWEATPDKVLHGTGCPKCANYRFDPKLPAWEYCFVRDDYLKYGITNDIDRRLNEHRKHGEIKLIHKKYHENGQLALNWEKHIKLTYGGRYVTKKQCPDGYTETLHINMLSNLIH